MNLRHLSYLAALAREGHFHRAALASNITQPTLSAAIRQLEEEVGTQLVRRSQQRFEGFTPEGLKVLEWARRILSDVDALKQSLAETRGKLRGHLRIGIIPTAEPLAGEIAGAFLSRHSGASITLLSGTSDEIERGIIEHRLEAGISYVDEAPPRGITAMPLYAERYVLIGTTRLGKHRKSLTWRDAAALPLVLLNREMQNRRLMDRHFAAIDAAPVVVAEASTLVGLLSHVRAGLGCGIIPRTFASLIGKVPGLKVLALEAPEASHQVGLLVPARTPLQPLTQALVDALRATPIAADH
ncbi:MAG TPA: LysR substrate-binding domain-containing protein [Burkholderiales bacterium]|jgi:DNA-binding transcriptional LysR family regulator